MISSTPANAPRASSASTSSRMRSTNGSTASSGSVPSKPSTPASTSRGAPATASATASACSSVRHPARGPPSSISTPQRPLDSRRQRTHAVDRVDEAVRLDVRPLALEPRDLRRTHQFVGEDHTLRARFPHDRELRHGRRGHAPRAGLQLTADQRRCHRRLAVWRQGDATARRTSAASARCCARRALSRSTSTGSGISAQRAPNARSPTDRLTSPGVHTLSIELGKLPNQICVPDWRGGRAERGAA